MLENITLNISDANSNVCPAAFNNVNEKKKLNILYTHICKLYKTATTNNVILVFSLLNFLFINVVIVKHKHDANTM